MPRYELNTVSNVNSTFIRGSDLEDYFYNDAQGNEDIQELAKALKSFLKKTGVVEINSTRRGIGTRLSYRIATFHGASLEQDSSSTDVERKLLEEFQIVMKLANNEPLTEDEKRHKINCSEMRSLVEELEKIQGELGPKITKSVGIIREKVGAIMGDFRGNQRIVREGYLYLQFRDRNIDELSLSVSRYTYWEPSQIHFFLVQLTRIRCPIYDKVFTLEKFLDALKKYNTQIDKNHAQIAYEVLEIIPDDDASEEVYIRLKDKIEALIK